MSLGAVVLLSAIISLDPLSSILFSSILMIAYQFFLNNGLENYILTAPRDNFLSMNREGIFGCIGFFSIFQIGIGLKEYLLVQGEEGKNITVALIIFSVLSYFIGGESRRLVSHI